MQALFSSCVYDNSFALVAAPDTKLTPESGLFRKEDYAETFAKETSEVYRYEDRRLFRTTDSYADAAPRRIAQSFGEHPTPAIRSLEIR
jgi:hypothetical protein